MATYDLVFHYGENTRTLLGIVNGVYTYNDLLRDVDWFGRGPPAEKNIMLVRVVSVDVEDPPERISVYNDADVMVMFERNKSLRKVHIYVEFVVVGYVVEDDVGMGGEDTDAGMGGEDADAGGEDADAGMGGEDEDVVGEDEDEGAVGGDDVGGEDLDAGEDHDGSESTDPNFDAATEDREDAFDEGEVSVDEASLEGSDLLSRVDDIMSDYKSVDGCGKLVSSSSDDDWESDNGAEFRFGATDPMSTFMHKDYYEQPADWIDRIQWKAKETFFTNVNECRNAVRDFAIREGFILKKVKNDVVRVTVECNADGCPWRFHASRLSDNESFMLKTYTDRHTCCRTQLNRASAEWISCQILPTLQVNPLAKPKQLKAIIEGFGVKADYMKMWRARQQALIKLNGDHETAFQTVPYYCRVLDTCIPLSRITLQYGVGGMSDEDEPETSSRKDDIPRMPHFKRLFVGLAPLREGFLAGCAPFISLDGCHLKGAFSGIILSATSLDGDNGLYPICWAVVESETKESWLFFLRNMELFLGGFGTDKPWTIMTDRQKGLIQAINEVIPHAINRKCVKHIFSNLAKSYVAKKLKKDFWAAARSYTEVKFWVHMEKIKEKSPRAYDWLMQIEPSLWSRHAYDTRLKNNHITNNTSESFNAWIGKIRDKPIMALLEGLRQNVMMRLQDRWLKAHEWTRPIMPNIVKKINDNIKLSRELDIHHSSPTLLEVSDATGHNIVNLAAKSCDCRFWEVSGWPCKHACKAIEFMRLTDKMSEFIDQQFLRAEFIKVYSHRIPPVPHEQNWNYEEMTDVTPDHLMPPPNRRLPGRPRVSRRRGVDEENPRRSLERVKCSRCGEYGHNKRTCQGGAVGSGRSRRRTRTYETSSTQVTEIDSDEPLGSYVHRSQRRRNNDEGGVGN